MANIYEDGYLTAAVDAIAALGNRIGLYTPAGARVGTVYADTTWGTTALSGTAPARIATKPGSKVSIIVPAGTVADGTVISHYGVHNGTTLLRRIDLKPITVTVNDSSQAFTVDVTPSVSTDGTE